MKTVVISVIVAIVLGVMCTNFAIVWEAHILGISWRIPSPKMGIGKTSQEAGWNRMEQNCDNLGIWGSTVPDDLGI